jgi:hypothetical protein
MNSKKSKSRRSAPSSAAGSLSSVPEDLAVGMEASSMLSSRFLDGVNVWIDVA